MKDLEHAGHPGDDIAPGTLKQHFEAGEIKGEEIMHRFLMVIEKAQNNYSAYSTDLPGCVATGKTREDVEKNMHGAIEMHVKGLIEDNHPVPESTSFAEYIAIS